jgi:predicted phosphodiesterase
MQLFNISFNRITCGATVYAVENEYQIVFSSSTESRAWVTIDGSEYRYFDDYNGANRTYTKIHKVSIPMDDLNNAKGYKIHVQKLTYRGPFGGYFGREITQDYDFRPIDASDGIDYYSISDVHMATKAAIKTVSHFDNIELLVLAGDIVSMMDTFADANLTNELSSRITKGQYPVIYARGNHEIKGKYAEELHNFVGSYNNKFYYNVYLDNMFVTVLDIGEDHDDDYWEYYDTAFYTDYRNKQVTMLEKTLEEKKYLDYEYKMAVCHIPVVFVNYRKNHTDIKADFTKLLNDLDINMCISGHQHDLLVFEPGRVKPNEKLKYNSQLNMSKEFYNGYLTDFNFVNLGVSKRGFTQLDSSKLTTTKSQIGVYTNVDFINNTQTVKFTNSKGEAIDVFNYYAEINYGNTLVFSLDTNKIV